MVSSKLTSSPAEFNLISLVIGFIFNNLDKTLLETEIISIKPKTCFFKQKIAFSRRNDYYLLKRGD